MFRRRELDAFVVVAQIADHADVELGELRGACRTHLVQASAAEERAPTDAAAHDGIAAEVAEVASALDRDHTFQAERPWTETGRVPIPASGRWRATPAEERDPTACGPFRRL
jgi:hypothetical protein